MPFPLAHPAAVLPLRRFCPRLLSFPALVVGSICPDLAYAFTKTGLSDYSHTVVGGTVFSVVTGSVLLGLLYASKTLVIALAPANYKDEVRHGLQVTPRLIPIILFSLAVGAWTHLLWDAFTHSHGWGADHLSFLRAPAFALHGRAVRWAHVLWSFCSFAGLAWLVAALRQWQGAHGPAGTSFRKSYLVEGIIVAALVVPIEILHHFVRSGFGLLLIGLASLLLSLLVLARPVTAVAPVDPQNSR